MSEAQTRPVALRRPIIAAAVASTYVERRRLFQGQSIIVLNDALARHPSSTAFNPTGSTAAIRSFMLEDVVLDGSTLVLTKDGQVIAETEYFVPDHNIYRALEGVHAMPVCADEVVVVGYNNAHTGYFHWLTQCLPAIDWSLRHLGEEAVRLLLPPLADWQEALLSLLGYADVPRFIPHGGVLYRLARVAFCDFVTGSASFDVSSTMMQTMRRIVDAVPARPSSGKVLYIREARPYYGAIRNEAAVLELLRDRGIAVVEPERLGIAERINLFRNADAIIGPTGQYLADVVFCRPGTLLWEWMPEHHQNQAFNRLAQAAELDYRGELFDDAAADGAWEVDLGTVAGTLASLGSRPARPIRMGLPLDEAGPPLDEVLLRFESLGDNCEFGFVQRSAGAEPLSLLRFNGFHVPEELRLPKLVAALERRFEGLGTPDTIAVAPEGVPGRRELIARESTYELYYHTGIAEGDAEPAVQVEREATRLRFLRRKLLEDLESGHKTFVWRSEATTRAEHVRPLLEALRRFGPNTLLWVSVADQDHPAGSIERLEPDFIRGYVQRFAPWNHAANIHAPSWFAVCLAADNARPANRVRRELDTVVSQRGDPPALAAIAAATVFIEREQAIESSVVVWVGDTLANHPGSMHYVPLATTVTLRNFTLRDVVLDGSTLLLLKDGMVIPESAYFTPPYQPERHRGTTSLSPLGENEVLIFGYNSQHWGYQHWLTQCLPAIDWTLRQERTETPRLLLPDLQPWQEDLLRLLGHDAVPRLQPLPDEQYHLPMVEFSDFVVGVNGLGISLSLLETIRRIADAVPAQPSAERVVFIRNAQSYYGFIRNESAAMDLLRGRGVAIVDPAQMETAERINLFRNADAVIGPLGGYLADVLFCRPGALLWEWMPRHHQNHIYMCMAQAAQIDYWGDLFESVPDATGPDNWEVDLGVIARRMGQLSSRLASAAAAEPKAQSQPAVPGSAMAVLAHGRAEAPARAAPKRVWSGLWGWLRRRG